MSGRMRKIQMIVGTLALLVALTVGAAGNVVSVSAEALTIGTVNGGWTPGNFGSSCEAADGQLIEVKGNGKNYSKCEFTDGSVNTCDWVKKVCTFGIMAGPFRTGNYQVTGTLTTTSGSGTSTSGGVQSTGNLTTKSK